MEGSDGTGKSTQTKLLKEELEKDNIVTYHHFPSYNTYQGEIVTRYLNGEFPDLNNPYAINSFYAVDRVVTYYKELKNHYENEEILLLDRYTTSSIIYQGTKFFNNDLEKRYFATWVQNYEYNDLGLPKPDLTIYLDIDRDLHYKLLKERSDNDGVKNDIHERDFEYLRNVADTGRMIANYLGWDVINVSENSKLRSIEDIHDDVIKLVKKRI